MRRSVRRIRRRFFAACFMFLFTVTVIAGHSMLTTLAEEEKPKTVPYYSSIEIQGRGQSLGDCKPLPEGKPFDDRGVCGEAEANEHPSRGYDPCGSSPDYCLL